jgi:hypothetical protein
VSAGPSLGVALDPDAPPRDADSDFSIAKLRAERLARERAEHERTRTLLLSDATRNELHGTIASYVEREEKGLTRLNNQSVTQFFPDLARQNRR